VIRVAQLLLLLSALGLWVASRLPWVSVGSSDGLGQPKTSTINGAAWSNALLPLAVLLLAAALAGLAVRGWLLRALAVLVALVCVPLGYLGISLMVMRDVAPRGAELAGVPVMNLVASQRHLAGAAVTLAAAVGALVAAALMMRAAATEARRVSKYAGPGAPGEGDAGAEMSERAMWDALDGGLDPTDPDTGATAVVESETEGR
jgi:uncharacterized membrane protein (TIGR02234 family)